MRRMRHGRNGKRAVRMGVPNYTRFSHRGVRTSRQNRSSVVPSYSSTDSSIQPKIADTRELNQPVKQSSEKNEIKTRINSKINDIQQKIQKQIESRRKYISKNISHDVCHQTDDNAFLRLKSQFIEYLINRSEKSLFQKYQFKKQLEKLRFKLESNQEDILVDNKSLLSSSQSPKSLLESDFSEWNEWKAILKQIGKNHKNFKLTKKGEKLNNVFEEYRNLIQEESENKDVICEECGVKNPAQSLHCHYCGNKL